MEDIIIAGYSVVELKKQRQAIQQEASKVVSDSVSKALALFQSLKEVETRAEAEKIAKEMYDLLETVQVVADVSDVTFFLPFTEEYGRYETEDCIGAYLEDNDNDALEYSWRDKSNSLYKLASLACSMESDSRDWHSSKC